MMSREAPHDPFTAGPRSGGASANLSGGAGVGHDVRCWPPDDGVVTE